MGNEASGHYHGDAYYGDDDFDDCHYGWGVNRSGWAAVSQAALRRGEKAQELFAAMKQEWESRTDLEPGTEHTIPVLDPSIHLVGKVWKDFRKHVKDSNTRSKASTSTTTLNGKHIHGYWNVQRRVATAEEKQTYKVTRKSKAYFVEATFFVPHAKNAAARSATAAAVPKKKTTTTKKNKKRGASVAPIMPPNSNVVTSVPSKKPRLLANLTNNAAGVSSTAGVASKKVTPTLQHQYHQHQHHQSSGAPAYGAQQQPHPMYAMLQPHQQAHRGIHSYKYGDIVGLVGSSISNQPNTLKLAMVIGLVNSHTLLIVHPNQVQATAFIHQVQLVKPMVMPMPTFLPATTPPTAMPMQHAAAVAPPMPPAASRASDNQKAHPSAAAVETSSTTSAGEENQQQQQQQALGVGH